MPESTQDQASAEVKIAPDPADYDRSGLEANVSAKMSDVFKDGDETLSDVPASETPAAEVATEPAKTETEEAAAETETAASEPAEKPTATAKPASTLPAAYRRSLKAYQWTDEEIANGEKANPEGFAKMAERIHAQRVQQTQQWADLGRQAKATTPAAEKPADAPKYDAAGIAALRQKYGNEPFIDQLEQQSKMMEYLQNQVLPYVEQSKARQDEQELNTLNKSIDGFFSGEDLKPYHDHYGKGGSTLTDAQVAARMKVLETADLLVRGARATARNITLEDALTMAHDSVSSPIAAKVAVKKVQAAVQQRQASISVRPGTRAAAPKAAGRSDLEKTVKTGLDKVFNKK